MNVLPGVTYGYEEHVMLCIFKHAAPCTLWAMTRVRTLQMIFSGRRKSCGCSDINNFNLNVELGQPNSSAI